jgi:hypothetical protein
MDKCKFDNQRDNVFTGKCSDKPLHEHHKNHGLIHQQRYDPTHPSRQCRIYFMISISVGPTMGRIFLCAAAGFSVWEESRKSSSNGIKGDSWEWQLVALTRCVNVVVIFLIVCSALSHTLHLLVEYIVSLQNWANLGPWKFAYKAIRPIRNRIYLLCLKPESDLIGCVRFVQEKCTYGININ